MLNKAQPLMKIELKVAKNSLSVKFKLTGAKVDFMLMDLIPRQLT